MAAIQRGPQESGVKVKTAIFLAQLCTIQICRRGESGDDDGRSKWWRSSPVNYLRSRESGSH